MKTAISIPDSIFERTERLARRTKRSRSRVVSDALPEYLARHSPDEVTEAMDRVIANLGDDIDHFVDIAGRSVLDNVEW